MNNFKIEILKNHNGMKAGETYEVGKQTALIIAARGIAKCEDPVLQKKAEEIAKTLQSAEEEKAEEEDGTEGTKPKRGRPPKK